MEDNRKKNTPLTWIVFIVVFIFVFLTSYELFSGKSMGTLFESKSDKCKLQAQERAVSLRDSRLKALELKENPTQQDLEEIEKLKIDQKTRLVSRDDYDYLYEECMR